MNPELAAEEWKNRNWFACLGWLRIFIKILHGEGVRQTSTKEKNSQFIVFKSKKFFGRSLGLMDVEVKYSYSRYLLSNSVQHLFRDTKHDLLGSVANT